MTAGDDETLTEVESARFRVYVEQRAAHKPLAYIAGVREFMGLDFEVNEHTLIPRPDTETVVEAALNIIKQTGVKRILEIGAGSGCISVSLAAICLDDLDITSTDIDVAALETAKRNADRYSVSVRFIQSDLFSNVDPGMFDMIISNPPYIPSDEIDLLAGSVANYEPRLALDGGADGLNFYRAVTEMASNYIVYEIGYNQAEDVRTILLRNGFTDVKVIKDLAGHNRVITAHK
jgi:release factor glutamine methyltransferase